VSETGKIEYAPDYKSTKKLPTIQEMSGLVNFGGRVVFEGDEQIVISYEEARRRDHAALKDAVVEAAKAWYHAELIKTAAERTLEDELEPRLVLAEATSALLQFEQEQK